MVLIWGSLHNNQCKLSTWVYRISLNVSISFYRKNLTITTKFTELNEQNIQITIDDKTETEQELNLLEQFISELKEIDKAIMVLYLEDKSHFEIAEILGMSVTNVGTKIGRIKEKLKTKFSSFK